MTAGAVMTLSSGFTGPVGQCTQHWGRGACARDCSVLRLACRGRQEAGRGGWSCVLGGGARWAQRTEAWRLWPSEAGLGEVEQPPKMTGLGSDQTVATSWKSLGVPQNVNVELTCDPSNSTPRCIPKDLKVGIEINVNS